MTRNPTLSDALQEAMASAPSDNIIVNTMSLWFDGLEIEGVPDELYFFAGYDGTRRENGVPYYDARLEDDARYHPGEVVEFIGIPFDVTLPDVSTETTSSGKLTIDGVGRDVTDQLQVAVEVGQPIILTYRQYLLFLEDDGPQNNPPTKFNISNVGADALTVSGEITSTNIGTKRFPNKVYTREVFPGLVL